MKRSLLLLSFLLTAGVVQAQEYDQDLADSLKIEANHNVQRLKSFRTEITNNKVFDEEREKGLAEFLEDQEKWDLLRDRGLQEYRRQKRSVGSPQEGGPEYLEYLEEKESQEARYERSRQIHVRTREKVLSSQDSTVSLLEAEELGLYTARPRYDLRKRSRNKWANASGSGRSGGYSGGSSGSSSFDQSNIPPANDFVPAPEFPPAPPAFDAGDGMDFAPAPTFDPNTGMPVDATPQPEINIPPPPPPTEFDF
ncbi:MAG: hypothetical protein K0R29_275 [Pseudobdellovibrio sp.]|nr:hypothetical protein [Pseudobdellovibrio sp.]